MILLIIEMKSDIILGQQFGKWTVIDTVPIYTKGGQRNVKVQCECGTIEYKHWSSLKYGKTTQCIKCKRLARRSIININETYKGYTVISEPINIKGFLKYKVRCKCGSEHYMTSTALLSNTRWFQCKTCSNLNNIELLSIRNGKVGDLSISMVNRIKSKAISRKIEFDLSVEYLWNLFVIQNGICAITGDKINHISEASLDRINSNKGYVENNVQWTTKQANKCKHILSMKELYEFAIKVISHANQQPSIPLTKYEGSETNS